MLTLPTSWWIGLESNQLPAVDLVPHSIVLPTHMNVCLSRLSLKFLRDGSVNVGHLSNTAADFCSPVRLLHSSVGVGFLMRRGWSSAPNSNRDCNDFESFASADWASGGYLVQPRLVENRVYAYKAYPQTVEDELGRKVARLVPSCQCLFHSHGSVSPTNVCVLFPHRQPHLSGGHRSFPVVRKESP